MIREDGRKDGGRLWLCRCDCGNDHTTRAKSLVQGATRSCGCLRREDVSRRKKTHGMTDSPEFTVWSSMLRRCRTPSTPGYDLYGGRGIAVCERWLQFENFIADMGLRPKGMTLDRIDSNGDYEPSNCRWATMKEQQNNRRNNVCLTFEGRTLTVSQWADVLSLPSSALRARVSRGWSAEKTLTTPIRQSRRPNVE